MFFNSAYLLSTNIIFFIVFSHYTFIQQRAIYSLSNGYTAYLYHVSKLYNKQQVNMYTLCLCFCSTTASKYLRRASRSPRSNHTNGVHKDGVIKIINVKQAAMSSALLAIAEVVPRKGAGSTRTRKTVAFSPKNGQLEVAAKPAGVSPFSYWEISLYIGSGYEETVLTRCRRSALAASACEF